MTSAILELPEVRQRVSRLSVEEYHRLDEYNERGRRTELIRGIVIEKISKAPLHRIIGSLLYRRILAQLPKGYSVWKEEPLTFLDSEPEPDIAIIRADEHDYARSHPSSAELVVEIAVSSPALDRENAALYAEAGIKEYWIVLGNERRVEVYRRPVEGHYQDKRACEADEVLECVAVPGVKVPVSELFV
ncbi:MAG: Uma2 family endonuclease [Verrucomicrobia bacterium]|nr:Uma2 family endonuclease [Verrucomicrobiota bacterium]